MYYRPDSTEPIRDDEMPPLSAMETVLPEYQSMFSNPNGRRSPVSQKAAHQQDIPSDVRTRPPDELDKASTNLLEHQMKELVNYRTTVHKMGEDIMTSRKQIVNLEDNNSRLRRDLAHYNDASKLMVDSSLLDGLSKPEILSRYAALKQTLNSQTKDIQNYKDKVQRLQNDLIKKNDKEKEYIRISQSHISQQELLQKYQERLKKVHSLEEACKQQEKVIERMEKVIEKQQKGQNKSFKGDKSSHEASEAILEENRQLRHQIQQSRNLERGKGGDDTEKLNLYQSLEKAQGRIMSLEKQLAENSKTWGKERADMNIRLTEAEHGLARSTDMVLHDYPVYNEEFRKQKDSPLYR